MLRKSLALNLAAVGLLVLMAVGCGTNSDDGLMNGSDESLELQRETHLLFEDIIESVSPAAVNTASGSSKCTPVFAFKTTGLSLTFTQTDTCKLSGEVLLTFVPFGAKVNLDVTGKFIKKISTQIELGFTDTANKELSFQFLDGEITLHNNPMFPGSVMVVNGKAHIKFPEGSSEASLRTNVFDKGTHLGFAVKGEFKTSATTKERSLMGCMLSGGDALNPDAGTLTACSSLIK